MLHETVAPSRRWPSKLPVFTSLSFALPLSPVASSSSSSSSGSPRFSTSLDNNKDVFFSSSSSSTSSDSDDESLLATPDHSPRASAPSSPFNLLKGKAKALDPLSSETLDTTVRREARGPDPWSPTDILPPLPTSFGPTCLGPRRRSPAQLFINDDDDNDETVAVPPPRAPKLSSSLPLPPQTPSSPALRLGATHQHHHQHQQQQKQQYCEEEEYEVERQRKALARSRSQTKAEAEAEAEEEEETVIRGRSRSKRVLWRSQLDRSTRDLFLPVCANADRDDPPLPLLILPPHHHHDCRRSRGSSPPLGSIGLDEEGEGGGEGECEHERPSSSSTSGGVVIEPSWTPELGRRGGRRSGQTSPSVVTLPILRVGMKTREIRKWCEAVDRAGI